MVKEGTGKRAQSTLVTIAGKTGTAQTLALRTGPEKDIPKKFRDHAWFVAFAPVEAPTIAVAVLGEHMGHGGSASAPLAKELIAFCRDSLADVKCPRSVDFRAELPRNPTGKLYKRHLKDEYWTAAGRSI